MYREKAIATVTEALAASRQKALTEAENRKEALYSKEPAFYRLDSLVAKVGMDIALSAFDNDAPQKLAVLRGKLEDLQREKKNLLAAMGLPENYLLPAYSCSLCEDSGFVSGKRCECFHRRLKALSADSLPGGTQGFDDFDITFYPAAADGNQPSPRSTMVHILQKAMEYAEGFDENSPSLLFLGKTGLGKTHLSLAVGNRVAQRGFSVEYTSAQAMIDRFERVRFDRGCSPEDREFARSVIACDLLILDDLGSEFITTFSQSVLYYVLNERLMAQHPVLISTNLEPSQLSTSYAERIASRILCGCTAYHFRGKDIRLERRLRQSKV